MISVSFTLHPNRAANLDAIYEAYENYDIVDEVLVVTGTEVKLNKPTAKFKFVHMPGPYTYGEWPSFGLLARYTWALNCKNRYVFVQDDDCFYQEKTMKKLLSFKSAITGRRCRWFHDGDYLSTPPDNDLSSAPIILTGGTLVDSWLLPDVIKYAKMFWKDYQNVFNGEDIFMSRAISYITGQDKFPIVNDSFTKLPTYNVSLSKNCNPKKSRIEICKQVYNFFSDLDEKKIKNLLD